ncbi:DUF6934 family protein [Pedobacter heparinus]|uniref:DUF6934 family protein n=1 Tax=Pedobacter heparinus TaxID=984 RepID=UPI00292F7772|nr:hypothetical protein [Pedobacter heparinus]
MTEAIYDLSREETKHGIVYFFKSKGKADFIKAIQYDYVLDYNYKKVYNFGFGDYDSINHAIDDSVGTENGDVYKVFNTVLSTIPMFFESFPDAVISVRGSDSSSSFIESCKLNCKRNCDDDVCKKSNRRINIYTGYVNKRFEELIKDFTFYGGIELDDTGPLVEDYIPGKKYNSVMVVKNNM